MRHSQGGSVDTKDPSRGVISHVTPEKVYLFILLGQFKCN